MRRHVSSGRRRIGCRPSWRPSNHDVDKGDLARADGLNKQLSSMIQQRDLLAKLPTWPWSTGTFRAFLTAILLPLFLFIVQRVLVQFV